MSVPSVALIGLSGYGRVHLQLARECRDRGELRIAAAAVINPEQEGDNIAELAAHGTEIFSDYRDMLRAHAGRLDLCLIPTGIHWHARMTIAALESGANVLVEKPLAGSVAEAEAVRGVEGAAGKFVAVGFQDFYDPSTVWLKQHLLGGAIGAVRSVRFLGIWPRSRAYFTRNDWAGRARLEGAAVLDSPLNNAFAHFVMLSQYFASDRIDDAVLPQLSEVELWRAHAIENYDTAVVTARTAAGVKLWFGVSHASREAVEPEIVIDGDDGTARWRYEKESVVQRRGAPPLRHAIPGAADTRRAMMAAVLARLSDPAVPICGTQLAMRHTALIEAIQHHATVRDFPRASVGWVTQGDSAVPNVAGLKNALCAAFERQEPLIPPGGAGIFGLSEPSYIAGENENPNLFRG